ncbi:sulfotransferase 1C4-like [Panulirus ornatus]|uniref:sulfotransferase 1C4-like n=1 Tax=Panulirus ornatus TaxID=150431 RepID=UPI003A852C20
MELASGHTVEELEGEELKRMERDFLGYTDGAVRIMPGRWFFPSAFVKFAENYYKFKFRESDVVVMTWPKCGTTWTQEIVWTMRNNPDLDNPEAKISTFNRVPFIEMDTILASKNIPPSEDDAGLMAAFEKLCPDGDPKEGIFFQIAQATPDSRTLKTHLPFSLLHPELLDTAKVVYVARNPMDVVVSFLHHSRLLKVTDFAGTLDQFVQYFVDDDLLYGPYWLHLKEAWERRDHPNLHFVFFEELKKNNLAELRKLNKFLETNLTEEQLQKVARYTNFSEMKVREDQQADDLRNSLANQDYLNSHGGFLRKGEVGDWKQHLGLEHKAMIDHWIERHLKDIGVSFPHSS